MSDGIVAIRPITVAEACAYLAHQDLEMADRFEWGGPITAEHLSPVIEHWQRGWATGGPERNFAITDATTGVMIGDCEVEVLSDGFLNVMYCVFAPWRGRGLGRRALVLLLAFAAETFPGSVPLFRIHPDNSASLALARSQGVTLIGEEVSRNGRTLLRLAIQ